MLREIPMYGSISAIEHRARVPAPTEYGQAVHFHRSVTKRSLNQIRLEYPGSLSIPPMDRRRVPTSPSRRRHYGVEQTVAEEGHVPALHYLSFEAIHVNGRLRATATLFGTTPKRAKRHVASLRDLPYSPSFSFSQFTTCPQSTRTCSSVSRSRIVTLPGCWAPSLPSVSPSMVIQNGVPASSWRA